MSDIGPVPGEGTRLADEEPLSPHEALALVEDQRHRVNRKLQVNVALVHGALGVAWLAGGGGFLVATSRYAAISRRARG